MSDDDALRGAPQSSGPETQADARGSSQATQTQATQMRGRGARAWLRWVCVEPERARPRALLRLLIHALGVLASYVVGGVLAWASGPSTAGRAAAIGLQTALVVLVTWACARFVDRRPPTQMLGSADRRAPIDLLVGVALGAGSIAVIALLEAQLGLAHYAPLALGSASLLRAGALLLFFVAVAIDEELWFRAYQLTNLAEGLSAWLGPRASRATALVLSALVFGLAHALNPNASLLSTANIAVGGVFLGITYAMTGRLWLALGLHFAWNTAQCLLDMPVSGQTLGDELLVHRDELGDDLVTGGAFGPEGGALGLSAMLLGTVLCVIHARLTLRPEVAKLDDAIAS
ncbi:MAG: CPBP family intramembrane metalloprotease [Sandaracinaceae bacterium]|nr:CPBP family intramembrane metalloprotease [Sandaracinaceae bacterium]